MTKSFLDVFLKPRESLYKATQKLSDPLFIDKVVQGGMNIAANVFPGVPAVTEGFKQGGVGGAVSNWNAEFDRRNLNPIESALRMGEGFLNPTGFTGSLKNVGPRVAKNVAKNIIPKTKHLTTKFLEYAKSKQFLSKQEILDFSRRPELKKGEADLLNRLGSELKETKVPAQEFADSIKGELLELKPVKVKDPQYQGTTLGMGGLETNVRRMSSEGKQKLAKASNYEEVVFESPIKTNGSSHFPNSKNYFAHARGDEVVEGGKRIWREQEIQSDLLQKGQLEARLNNNTEYLRLSESRGGLRPDGTPISKESIDNAKSFISDSSKLDPFTNDRFGERIMRERIKEKAKAGYSKYRLPTGETIGKIEGFENPSWMIESGTNRGKLLTTDNLKVGDEVMSGDIIQNNNQWIITDILGDGRFKAVPRNALDYLSENFSEIGLYGPDDTISAIAKGDKKAWEILKKHTDFETFDLTGKSNPQARRYEQWGKFLKNKYGGKEIVDSLGDSWIEADIKPEFKKLPIEAFGFGAMLNKKQEEKAKQRQELFISR